MDNFAALQQEYLEAFQPQTPVERYLVYVAASSEWRMRRYLRLENDLWRIYHDDAANRALARIEKVIASIHELHVDAVTRLLECRKAAVRNEPSPKNGQRRRRDEMRNEPNSGLVH